MNAFELDTAVDAAMDDIRKSVVHSRPQGLALDVSAVVEQLLSGLLLQILEYMVLGLAGFGLTAIVGKQSISELKERVRAILSRHPDGNDMAEKINKLQLEAANILRESGFSDEDSRRIAAKLTDNAKKILSRT